MEIYVRRAQDSLNKMTYSSYDEKYEVIRHFYEVADSIQSVFDSETDNGTNEQEIEKWNAYIEINLYGS
tara:strand:+ start:196 stop:402 length:207 start_codon:yes stop_codon:yes gene_type:complete